MVQQRTPLILPRRQEERQLSGRPSATACRYGATHL